MAPKKEKVSKGNIFNLFEDASKDQKLQKKIQAVLKTKGKGLTPVSLRDMFDQLGYDGVSLRDCKRLLNVIKSPIPLEKGGEWAY